MLGLNFHFALLMLTCLFVLINTFLFVFQRNIQNMQADQEPSLSVGKLRFQLLTNYRMNEALELLKQSLIRRSQFSIFGRFDVRDEVLQDLEQLCRYIISDGFSVIAVDESNGNVIGVAFNKVRVSEDCSFFISVFSFRFSVNGSLHGEVLKSMFI